jgi:hypothetical protein
VDLTGISWDYESAFVYDGSEKSVELKRLPDDSYAEYSNSKATQAGTYVASADVISNDPDNRLASRMDNLVWRIEKGDYDMSHVYWDYDSPFTYDGETKSVELTGVPEGIHVDYENASGFNAGVYNAHAVLEYDSDNMFAMQPADCQWKINRDRFDISGVRWDYNEAFTYDGKEHGVYLEGLPEGINVEYSDNIKIDAGKYVATAVLSPSDPQNYETPEVNGCTWAINKAQIEKPDLEWTDCSGFVYDGTDKTVEITGDIGDDVTVEYVFNKYHNAGRYYAKALFTAVDDSNYLAWIDTFICA